MEQFFQELADHKQLVISVLAAIVIWIIVFIVSLKLRRGIDAKVKSREEEFLHSSQTVKAVRRESSAELEIQGNPIYKTGRRYFAHYTYEAGGKKNKYHVISSVFPTPTITLAYRKDPKKAVWIHDIPKPRWYKPAILLLWLSPFAAAVLTVFLFGGIV